MKLFLLSLCIGLLTVGCGSMPSPSPGTGQYSYTYDFTVPMAPVETVVITTPVSVPYPVTAPAPAHAATVYEGVGTSYSKVPPAPTEQNTTPATVTSSQPGAVTATFPVVTTNYVTTTVPVPEPTSTTTTSVIVSDPGEPIISLPPSSLPPSVTVTEPSQVPIVPGTSQNKTTIAEPSGSQTHLERKTVVIEAPVKPATNQNGTAEKPLQPER